MFLSPNYSQGCGRKFEPGRYVFEKHVFLLLKLQCQVFFFLTAWEKWHMHLGCKLRKAQMPHVQVHTQRPSSPLCSSITGVGELPVPWKKAQQPPRCPAYLQVPTTGGKQGLSYGSYRSARRERRRRRVEEDLEEVGGESPCCARPQPCFPMPTSDHLSHQGAARRDSDISSHSGWEMHRKEKRDERGEMSETRNLQTFTSSLCSPSTARAPHKVRYWKADTELHISIRSSNVVPGLAWVLLNYSQHI